MIFLNIRQEKVDMLKRKYPAGTQICLGCMEGEPQMPSGLKGEVFHVDDMGQIHVQWENGSTLALDADIDRFSKVSRSEKTKEEGVSR